MPLLHHHVRLIILIVQNGEAMGCRTINQPLQLLINGNVALHLADDSIASMSPAFILLCLSSGIRTKLEMPLLPFCDTLKQRLIVLRFPFHMRRPTSLFDDMHEVRFFRTHHIEPNSAIIYGRVQPPQDTSFIIVPNRIGRERAFHCCMQLIWRTDKLTSPISRLVQRYSRDKHRCLSYLPPR